MLSDLERQMREYPWHTQYKLLNGKLNAFPFSHMICEDFLHPALFEAVREECRDVSKFQQRFKSPTLASSKYRSSWSSYQRGPLTNAKGRTGPCAVPKPYRHNPGLCIQDDLQKRNRTTARRGSSAHSYHLEIVDDRSGYALLPHVDMPQKLITC